MAYLSFISYARSDSEFALRISQDLNQTGKVVWIDQINIKPGDRWDSEIENALNESNILLVVLSTNSINSTNVMNEILFAINESKHIVPLRIDKCRTPLIISRFQYIDFTGKYEEGLLKLRTFLNELSSNADILKQPTSQVLKPIESKDDPQFLSRTNDILATAGIPPKRQYRKLFLPIIGLIIFSGLLGIILWLNQKKASASDYSQNLNVDTSDVDAAITRLPDSMVKTLSDSVSKTKPSEHPIVTVLFSINPESSPFRCVASLSGEYDVYPNYILLRVEEAAIFYRRADANEIKIPRNFESLKVRLFKTIPNQTLNDIRGLSRPYHIGKTLNPGEGFKLPAFTYKIITEGIEDLSTYKFFIEILLPNVDENGDMAPGYTYVDGSDFIIIKATSK